MQKATEKNFSFAEAAQRSEVAPLKIMVATPHTNDMEANYTHSIALLFPAMPAHYNYQVFENALLSEGRSDMVKLAVEWDADFLLFLDSDQKFPADLLKRLISLKRDVATGVYYKRKSPFHPLVYEFMPNGQVRNLTTLPDKPFRVDACGAGCLLISKKVIKSFTKDVKLGDGLFEDRFFGQPFHHITFLNEKTGEPEQLSEDVSFCHRLQFLGFEIWADPTIRIGHEARFTVYKEHFDQMLAAELAHDKVGDGEPDGWMAPIELEFLRKAAAMSESVLEIGSWKGRSTKALLESCPGTVTAVDHFQGSEDYDDSTLAIARHEPIYDIFMKNVGHFPNLKVLKMDSAEAAKEMPDGSVDMIFIDSDHRYEQVKAEIDRWLPKCKGMICGHDYADGWPGVKRAVEERFEKFHVRGSIWFVILNEEGEHGQAEKE